MCLAAIYSTCKRISQKLLRYATINSLMLTVVMVLMSLYGRNVVKFFLLMIENDHKAYGFKVIRQNMEEITLQGCNGESDQRTVNVSLSQ